MDLHAHRHGRHPLQPLKRPNPKGDAISELKHPARFASAGKGLRAGLLGASLLACLTLLALQGRASGQPRAVWNDTITVRKVAFSPDGKTLASVSSGGDVTSAVDVAVRLWDAATGKETASLPNDLHSGCSLLTFTSNGKGLVVSASRHRNDAEVKSRLNAERAIL